MLEACWSSRCDPGDDWSEVGAKVLFEVLTRRRELVLMFLGRYARMQEAASEEGMLAGSGMQSVDGRPRPGKVLSKMLTIDAMLADRSLESRCVGQLLIRL